jgi:hypothetical protein
LAQEGTEIITESFIVALYRNAGNEFKIISPSIVWNDSVRYSCSGAEVFRNGSDHRIVTLMPHAPVVVLSIYRDSTLIGTKKFKVRLIPKPAFKLYADRNLIKTFDSINLPISKATIDFTVQAIPDELLAKDLPQDARYMVKYWVISLVRERKVIDSLSFTDETGNIQRLLSQSKTGDLLHVEIKKVQRTNFLNQKETVHLPITIKIIPLE